MFNRAVILLLPFFLLATQITASPANVDALQVKRDTVAAVDLGLMKRAEEVAPATAVPVPAIENEEDDEEAFVVLDEDDDGDDELAKRDSFYGGPHGGCRRYDYGDRRYGHGGRRYGHGGGKYGGGRKYGGHKYGGGRKGHWHARREEDTASTLFGGWEGYGKHGYGGYGKHGYGGYGKHGYGGYGGRKHSYGGYGGAYGHGAYGGYGHGGY